MYTESEQRSINKALKIIESNFKRQPMSATSSRQVGNYARIMFGNYEHEVFSILHLDNAHQLIETEVLFRGTIDGAAVYPREVLKSVLAHNAAAVVLIHNHPSGNPEPSQADIAITERLVTALSVIEVRVLDHIVASAKGYTSMSERGLL